MIAGRNRHRVTIQSLVEARDSYGQPAKSWLTVATVWAEILTVGGGEQPNANRVTAEATHTVKIRRNVDTLLPGGKLLPTMRLLYEGRVFGITNVKDRDFRHREYWIYCREIVET